MYYGHDHVSQAVVNNVLFSLCREALRKPREEEPDDMMPPVFDLMPEPQQVEEGETAKFMVKISGNPRPRLTWWINGAMVVSVSLKISKEILLFIDN